MAEAPFRTWLLIDGLAGNESQVRGVAEALERENPGRHLFEEKRLSYGWLGALPNSLLGATFMGLAEGARAALAPPWPDLVIAAGRRTAPVALRIKAESDGAARLVQVMYPGGRTDGFDLIAVPMHDALSPLPNGLTITGAPHRVTASRLEQMQVVWSPRLATLPPPRIALIVGGSTRRQPFTREMGRDLGLRADQMAAAAGGSLMVTTSRRTGVATDPLVAAIGVPNLVYRWGQRGDNPYFGYLACADAIVVTGDSVSMASEACAARVPVYIYAPPGSCSAKHVRLHADLVAKGYARMLEPGTALESWSHPPLNAADDIAKAISERVVW